jgi:hypothetical protein
VWFGGNHGFAWGNPTWPGSAATHCFGANYGNYKTCSGVYEHIHPGAVACGGGPCTYRFYGSSVSPSDGSLWVGGWIRSFHYDFGNHGAGFWDYEQNQFNPSWQFDVWPDSDAHPGSVHGWDDQVTSVAAMGDGSAYYGSWGWGLAHIGADGSIGYLTVHDGLLDNHVTGLARDTNGGESLWVGGNYDGLSRLKNGHFTYYDSASLGLDPAVPVSDVQIDSSQSPRRVLVGFSPGVVGLYSGN